MNVIGVMARLVQRHDVIDARHTTQSSMTRQRALLAPYRKLPLSIRTARALVDGSRRNQLRFFTTSNDKEPTHLLPKTFAIGSFAGLLGSLAGMGGGFVMVPLMTSFLRLSQHQAHGTSLFAVAATGLAGAISYEGEVQWESAAAVALCGMATARQGAAMTSRMSEKALQKALGVFMLCVAPLVPGRKYIIGNGSVGEGALQEQPFLQRIAGPSVIGLASGFLAGLFGVGGGTIVVPALTVATDMNHYQALGTSLCAMTLPALVGTATHYSSGNVAMRVAPTLAVASFVGAYFGGKVGLKTNEDVLRWGFSGLMIFLGARNLIKIPR